jgi:nicotinamidase-related amidase
MNAVRGLENRNSVALLIRECQNFILPEYAMFPALAAQVQKREIISKIAHIAAVFRSERLPVFHIPYEPLEAFRGSSVNCKGLALARKSGKLEPGAPSVRIVDALAPHANDIVVRLRHGVGGFHGSDLELYLREFGIRTVVLVGVSTDIALPSMTVAAVDRGFVVVIPEDCTAGATQETHDIQIAHFLPMLATISTSDSIIKFIKP